MIELLYYGYNHRVNSMMTGTEPVESRKGCQQ